MKVNDIVNKIKDSKNINEELVKLKKEKNIPSDTIADARKELIKIVKDRSMVKLSKKADKPEAQYKIVYDSIGRGLEPFYFWILDFMRNPEIGMEVNKIQEEFEATAGGGYFGELGTKASVMQDRAVAMLERVNAVIRSILTIVYDLKDFEQRLDLYDKSNKKEISDEKINAEYALKSIWMDQVDIKEGRGSVNSLAAGDLQFVTLRDAFMQAKSDSSIKKMDLNKRVKIILGQKISKYLTWRKLSEQELRKRYSVEKGYLKAQVESLKIYTKWARPYLRAAQKLKMGEFKTKAGLPSPEMVTAFNNMMMELSLFGKKEIDPKDVHPSYKKKNFETKYFACIGVELNFRTIPQVMQGQDRSQHFVHTGVLEIIFTPYAMTEQELNLIEKEEVYEDMYLVESLTEHSLDELQSDIDKFLLKDDDKEDQEENKKSEPLFGNPFVGIKEIVEQMGFTGNFFKQFSLSKSEGSSFAVEKIKKETAKIALEKCLKLYEVFKKSHRMIQW